MPTILSTLDTFQLLRGWLKEFAFANIATIYSTVPNCKVSTLERPELII